MNWHLAKRTLSYSLKSNHFKGFGIQSPFIFGLVSHLFREKQVYYDFERIEAWRQAQLRSKQVVKKTDLGAGSKVTRQQNTTVGRLVKDGALPKKYGELLYRLAVRFEARNVLELGTSTGISTLYLALPYKKGKTISLEGCPESARVARAAFAHFRAGHIQVLEGSFGSQLPRALELMPRPDLVFFDGDHREEATLSYFEQCLPYVHNNTLFVFDDIHWSPGMERAWEKICAHPKITVSLDLLRLGLVFFRRENKKEHFTVRF